ncbi:maleylpyruvate isomerase family mycothiol-dependent enzyme [Calidifontibacter sp. DB0510]|uniref:Maleylpyruvate isomerase family mycothiol-dependent enzyme n=1 Tax=Metallococcus carri TaxID=1656884 RepID=A0A967EFK1_9MICO|nr:maleylpyruvate isomerase family mycothiol-dependent enzyme [Metallococcus carri]NHN56701.1 maleylpyruvate isomerase family mycothiol-dependent enzyme [Metallococcus carri]NOP37922.1 maleylpyruvate isomerase family mycothiol-dependent enzyme [Calidifontibacter sp. DB2511S]
MPTRPQPPSELADLIEAWTNTAQAVLDLGITAKDEDFDLQTQCPGWTVKDQISHVVGVERMLAGLPEEAVEVPDYPWLLSELGRGIEASVEVRRSRSGAEVVAEWQDVLPLRTAQIHGYLADPEQDVPGPFGLGSPQEILGFRVIDVWCHEQDLRNALNHPGNLDSPAAALFTKLVLDALPRVVARTAALPVGTTVIIEVTGPVQARRGVRVIEGEDGRPRGEALFSGDALTAGHETDEATTIRLSTEELTRRGAGRVAVDELRYSVEGDEDVARRVLDALAITP